MSRSSVPTIVAVVLSLAAAQISFNLFVKHMTGSSGVGWFEAGCTDSEGAGAANCTAVITSRYGYFPPKREDEPEGAWHIPAAFLGLVYYSGLAVWFMGVGRPSRARAWLHWLPSGALVCGLLGSVFYTYVMFTDLNEWCPWCLVTHLLNLCVAVCVVWMWPGEAKAHQGADRSSDGEADRGVASGSATVHDPPVHPSGRLLLMTGAALAFLLFGQSQLLGRANWRMAAGSARHGLEQCLATVERLQANTRKLVRDWNMGDKHEIHIRPDDPVRTDAKPGEPTWDLVVFSDLACPPCKKACIFLEQRAQPLFAGRLKIVFKHFPLNKDCNARTKSQMHKYACLGAAVAEAARVLGGPEAFWRAHDLLFAEQERLNKGELGVEQIAIELRFDPSQFEQTMKSETVARRVWEDVNSTASLGIRGTPTVFLNGRKVDSVVVSDIDFWNLLADRYWHSIKTPRPDSTKLQKAEATRDSQDQTDAP